MARPALKDHLRETRLFNSRAIVAGVLVVLLMGALAARLAYLQITLHDHYRTLSRENRVKLVPLPPTRGLIYDRNGVLLADNYPSYSLEITPDQVRDMEQTLQDLARVVTITGDDLQRFHRARRQQRRFDGIPIRVKLDEEEVARFAVVRHRFPGVDIQARLLRRYPDADRAVHVLGYVGRINQQEQEQIDPAAYAGSTHIGKLGIERFYEDDLHGQVGLQQVEVNALGRVIRVLETRAPVPGQNLRLHLDMGLQEAALEALGEEQRLNDAFFNALIKERRRLNDEAAIASFVAQYGVDAAKFREAYNSFGVNAKVRRAEQLAQQYRIDAVPKLVVDGRFKNGDGLASYGQFLEVADFLIAESRKLRQPGSGAQ